MKAALIIISIILVTLIALFAGGYYWFNENKDRYIQDIKKWTETGVKYGQNKTHSQCMDAVAKMQFECDGSIACRIAAGSFIRACMRTAKPDQFCEDIPKPGQILNVVSWSTKTCNELGKTDGYCDQYIQDFVSACEASRAAQAQTQEEPAQGRQQPAKK